MIPSFSPYSSSGKALITNVSLSNDSQAILTVYELGNGAVYKGQYFDPNGAASTGIIKQSLSSFEEDWSNTGESPENWLYWSGGGSSDYITEVDFVDSGNYLVATGIGDSDLFGSSGNGKKTVFVSKLNALTGDIEWSDAILAETIYFPQIAGNTSGGLTAGAIYGPSLSLGSTSLSTQKKSSFAASYDSKGKVSWAKNLLQDGSSGAQHFWGLDSLSDGSIIATGSFQGENYLLDNETVSSDGDYDAYIIKLDNKGNTLWKSIYAKGSGAAFSYGVASLSDGTSYVAGNFSGQLEIGGKSYTAENGADIYIAKLTSGGEVAWSSILSGDEQQKIGASSLAIDGEGNAILSGMFEKELKAGGIYLSTDKDSSSFLASFSETGSVNWIEQIAPSVKTGTPSIASNNAYILLANTTDEAFTYKGLNYKLPNQTAENINSGQSFNASSAFAILFNSSGDVVANYSGFKKSLDTASKDKNSSSSIETSSALVYEKYYSALTSGNAALTTKTSKKINWKTFSDFSTVDSSFYSALEWSAVNMKSLQKYQATSIDWTLVGFSSFETKQYKQTDWSQVNVSSFTSSEYTEIDWGKVSYSGKKSITQASGLDWTQVNFDQVFASPAAYKKITWSEVSFSSFSSADYSEIQWDKVAFKGKKSVSYTALDWSQIDFQDFSAKTFKQVNWKEAQTDQLTTSQYSAINWSYVALKGKKSADYSKLDWSKVITNDTFSAKAAKKVDWSQVTYSALDSAALAKLKQDAFSAKNKKLTAWLDANTTSTTGSGSQSGISFAGIAQPQAAGALTSEQGTSGSTAQVLLAAVEKQPVLI